MNLFLRWQISTRNQDPRDVSIQPTEGNRTVRHLRYLPWLSKGLHLGVVYEIVLHRMLKDIRHHEIRFALEYLCVGWCLIFPPMRRQCWCD